MLNSIMGESGGSIGGGGDMSSIMPPPPIDECDDDDPDATTPPRWYAGGVRYSRPPRSRVVLGVEAGASNGVDVAHDATVSASYNDITLH
jgi:hypothetical protein